MIKKTQIRKKRYKEGKTGKRLHTQMRRKKQREERKRRKKEMFVDRLIYKAKKDQNKSF